MAYDKGVEKNQKTTFFQIWISPALSNCFGVPFVALRASVFCLFVYHCCDVVPSWCFMRLPRASWHLLKPWDTSWCFISLRIDSCFLLLSVKDCHYLIITSLLHRLQTQTLHSWSSTKRQNPPWGKFWPLRTLWHNLHMFLDYLEFREENKTNCLAKLF